MTITGSHFVGSLNTATARESFLLASQLVGNSAKTIPDGEFGERFHWILFQGKFLDKVKGITRVGDEPILLAGFDIRPFDFDGTITPTEVKLPNLGYADAALTSYREFKDFKNDAKFSRDTRFQISLPSPIAVTTNFFINSTRERIIFESLYEAALINEIKRILRGIPAEDLAFQFDLAIEFVFIEKLPFPGFGTEDCWYGDPVEDAAWRIADIAAVIPKEIPVGIHLCYGDVAEKHFMEPKDTTNIVAFSNAITKEFARPLNWIHLPVPIDRDDDAYYAPLTGLDLSPITEVFLGIIHREDGAEGLARRAETASKFVNNFGISTECGFGRSPIEDREEIFALHKVI
jgi:methionine synthase II (cobalamin-independent)